MRAYVHSSRAFERLYFDYYRATLPPSVEITYTRLPEIFNDVLCSRLDFAKYITNMNYETVKFEAGNLIAITGCDMIFNGDFIEHLIPAMQDCDIAAMDDGGHLCFDFQIVRCTPCVIDLYRRVRDYVHLFRSDQTCFNSAVKTSDIRWKLLPYNLFWNVRGALPSGRGCKPGSPIPPPVEGLWDDDLEIPKPPREILVFHANYCEGGLQNKIKLLDGMQAHLAAGRFQ